MRSAGIVQQALFRLNSDHGTSISSLVRKKVYVMNFMANLVIASPL